MRKPLLLVCFLVGSLAALEVAYRVFGSSQEFWILWGLLGGAFVPPVPAFMMWLMAVGDK